MNKKRAFQKIKSKYILETIFDYIKEDNFKYKLLIYSKLFQKKLELKLVDYQERYVIQFGIKINNYLYCDKNEKKDTFNKNILSQNLEKDLIKLKIDKNILENIVLNIFNKKKNNLEIKYEDIYMNYKEYEDKIEIYSPLLDILSKDDEIFKIFFTIPIPMKIIKKFNLKNDYISCFNKLNDSNSKYSSIIFNIDEFNDINYLKEFKINFNQIKRLSIIEEYKKIGNIIYDYSHFFKTLFSFDNIENNLVYLNLDLFKYYNDKIEPILMENLNIFKSLKYLYLSGFIFYEIFVIKLITLKILSFECCHNITLTQNSCLNLKELYLEECSIINNNSLFLFPNLELCDLFNLDNQNYYKIIKFENLQKLKNFSGEISDFLYLDSKVIEEVTLYSLIDNSLELEINTLKKIFSLKNLKKINLDLSIIDDEEISKIQGENNSVIILEINWQNELSSCILNNLISKFPELNNLQIHISFLDDYFMDLENVPLLKITENPNSKINKFSLNIEQFFRNIQFYCISFEKLVEVTFDIEIDIKNIKEAFPIFNNKCKIIFKSLKKFHFRNYSENKEYNYQIINNIYKNFHCLPNLENFLLDCVKPIKEDLVKKFIKKILYLKLKIIHFIIKDRYKPVDPYSEDELKEIWPEIIFNNNQEIIIQKNNFLK